MVDAGFVNVAKYIIKKTPIGHLKKSLDKTKRKINCYLNYYTSVMSRKGFIHN